MHPIYTDQCLDKGNISADDITKKLTNKFNAGVDMIFSFLIKDFSLVCIEPLLTIFNLMLRNYTLPKQWKAARIYLAFKTGEVYQYTNYRPIPINLLFFQNFSDNVATLVIVSAWFSGWYINHN